MELALETVKDKFVACDTIKEGDKLDDVTVRLPDGEAVSLKQLLKQLGEI